MGFFSGLIGRPSSAATAPPPAVTHDVVAKHPEAAAATSAARAAPPPNQCIELGKIRYVNLAQGSQHGDMAAALGAAKESGKPLFVNFVEFPGWRGCKEAGKMFADPVIVRAAEELFTPCAFNTYDRYDKARNEPMRRWSAGLAGSWWGYLRLVTPDGQAVVSGTRQLTGAGQSAEVKQAMREALEELNIEVPAWFK